MAENSALVLVLTVTVKVAGSTANAMVVALPSRRLQVVYVFREVERDFAIGEKIQVPAPNKDPDVANRDLGTITTMWDGQVSVRMDGTKGRSMTFDPHEFRQFDHG